MRPASYDVWSRDVLDDGENNPPIAFHSENYGKVHVRYLTKGEKRGYPAEDQSYWRSSEI